jgi:hypothetical protein
MSIICCIYVGMAGEKEVKKKFFLLPMHLELWKRVNEEAAREARSAGMQIQWILLQHYRMDAAQHLVSGTRDARQLTARRGKNGKKRA